MFQRYHRNCRFLATCPAPCWHGRLGRANVRLYRRLRQARTVLFITVWPWLAHSPYRRGLQALTLHHTDYRR